MKSNYRILAADFTIKYAETGIGSWWTLEQARELVNYSAGEMIYEFDKKGNRLYEVF